MKNTIRKFIREHKSIPSEFGDITIESSLGEGANGLVYSALLLGREIAVKILTVTQGKKLDRFKEEFVLTSLLPCNDLLVECVHFQYLKIDENLVPLLLMKKYDDRLTRPEYENPSCKDIEKLFNFLINAIEFIHNNGIIHRDIKPENILTKEGSYYLGDFGIAHYNEELQRIAKTSKGERLANFSFSAPEQSEKGYEPIEASDLYAMAQVIQWYSTGAVHKGTKRTKLSSLIDGVESIDRIIDQCLANDPGERLQSVTDIRAELASNNNNQEVPRDWGAILDDFSDALLATLPKRDHPCVFVDDPLSLDRLMRNLNSKSFRDYELHYILKGGGDMHTTLSQIKDNKWLLRPYEIGIESAYLHIHATCPDYDVIILNIKANEPFPKANEIGGLPNVAGYVDELGYITISELENGYVEVDEGDPLPIQDMKKEIRHRFLEPTSIVLCSNYHGVYQSKFEDKIISFMDTIQPDGSSIEAFTHLVTRELFGVLHPTVSMWR